MRESDLLRKIEIRVHLVDHDRVLPQFNDARTGQDDVLRPNREDPVGRSDRFVLPSLLDRGKVSDPARNLSTETKRTGTTAALRLAMGK